MEEWKDIPSLHSIYQASNFGRIRRKPGTYTRNVSRGEGLVKCRPDKDGYRIISFCINGTRYTKKVHRIVAEAFIPVSGDEVNHKDGNKQNNCIENLEWCNRVENIAHSVRMGKSPRGERSSSGLDDMQVLTIYTMKGHTSHKELGEIYKCSPRSIPQIQNGRRWIHLYKLIYG